MYDMKHIKNFNESTNSIDNICKKYDIQNYTINSNGSIDVDDHVSLSNNKLSIIPLEFNVVSGNFYCRYNKLTSLEGCPVKVGGEFDCSGNKLISLKGCPVEVGDGFYCNNNKLTSLEGCPRIVGSTFNTERNQLISLEGCPEIIGGYLYCNGNPIYEIYSLFLDHKSFLHSLDHNYFRGTNIIKKYFKEACDEIDIYCPDKITGYKYI